MCTTYVTFISVAGLGEEFNLEGKVKRVIDGI